MDFKELFKIADMARLNKKETQLFPYKSYYVYLKDGDHNPPHFHIHSVQEKFDVRVDFNGNILSVKFRGDRTDKVEDYKDVQRKVKEWLKRKPASKKVAMLFKTNKDYIEFEWDNPDD